MLDDTVALLQEMIRNKCINPPGGEMRNIKSVGRYLDSHDVAYEVFESDEQRGNLLANINGTGGKPSLMLGPSHIDVVPVEDESRWRIPPFEGSVQDDCVWGRGALDMLYIVAAQTVAFSRLHLEGFKPAGDLKLLIVADEESAGTFGAKWMIEKHPKKVAVDYLITEQGGEPVAEDKIAYWYGEKGMAWTRIKFRGEQQHGSTPYKSNNAVLKAALAAKRLGEYQPPRDTRFIRPILQQLGVRSIARLLAGNRITLPRVLEAYSKQNLGMTKFLHALTQMTISPNILVGGTKVNIIPGEAILDVDIRLLPGQTVEDAFEQVKKALGSLSREAEISLIPKEQGGDSFPGTSSKIRSPLVEMMENVAKELRGHNIELVPLMTTGGTDARLFRKAFGTQAYGFALSDGMLDLQTIQGLFHGDNERITIGTIDLTTKAYYEITKRFLA